MLHGVGLLCENGIVFSTGGSFNQAYHKVAYDVMIAQNCCQVKFSL
jgi:hypothetical protein